MPINTPVWDVSDPWYDTTKSTFNLPCFQKSGYMITCVQPQNSTIKM